MYLFETNLLNKNERVNELRLFDERSMEVIDMLSCKA